MADNLFINKRNVPYLAGQYSVAVNNSSGINQMDYNNLYSSSPSGYNFTGYWMGQTAATLADWQAITGKDLHSVSTPVAFTSINDLHISGSSLGNFDLAGILIPGISTDIDGEPRPQQYPYMGADENLAYPLPVELTSFTAEVNNNGVLLKWSTASELNNRGFEIERRSPGCTEWEIIAFIPGTGTSGKGFSYSYEDIDPGPGWHSYRLKQYDYDGSYHYSAEARVQVNIIPEEFSLLQNYPNPFNPATAIRYSVPVTANVKLEIYNALGEVSEVLVDELKAPGRYEVLWNASAKASGVYFYRLTATSSGENQTYSSY
jgi:hypothetical protein